MFRELLLFLLLLVLWVCLDLEISLQKRYCCVVEFLERNVGAVGLTIFESLIITLTRI